MRNIIIAILLLTAFTAQSQTKWRQIERSLTKWNVPAAYDSIPGQAGYAGKWIALTALLDSLGIDSLGGGGGIEGVGLANRVAYWKSADTITFDSAMYWDKTNKRLGFNTTTPTRTVDIEGRARINYADNIFINGGNQTLSGTFNIGIGDNAIDEVTSGSNNFAMGIGSQTEVKAGSQNVGLGNQSLRENETGNDNVGIGYEALYAADGSQNVAIGAGAGSNADGSGNIMIGHNAGASADGNELFIDNSSTGTPLIGGQLDKNRVGINRNIATDTLQATLHVGGTVIVDTRTGTMSKYAGFDTNGKLVEFTPSGGGTIDSTIVADGYGINVNESPANTFTVSADTSQVVTPYDLSLVDQSITNEIQVIDTFQIYDTNKLRISLSQDNQPAKFVTLPSPIDSTVVSAGFGLTSSESPANTWNIAADSTKLATQHDISGFIDGAGTATRPAIWSDLNTLTSDSNLDWNNTDKRLLIGPNTAATTANKLQVVGTGTLGQYIMQVENEANVTSAGGINIFGNNTNTSFVPLNTNASTTGSVIINNTNSNTGGGSAYINTSVNGTTGDAYIITQKASGTAWSMGMKQSNSYAGRFTISESSTLTSAGERFSIGTGGVVRIKALDTDAAAPATSGTTKAVITDANGDLSYTDFPTAIDSTVVSAGYGLTATESPANTFTVAADTSKLVTPYDLSLVDQSETNEIQTIDTFQVYDTNKLRISLSNDGEAAKVVTLPTGGGGGIDSTIVTAGWGIDVTESPLNTFTVKADTAEVATQYDLTLLGTVKSIATSAPISGGTITGSGTIGLNYDSNTLSLSGSNLVARNGSAIWNADKLQNTNIKSVLSPSIGNVLTYTASNQWEAQAPSAGTTNLTFSGSASPFTLNSDTGTDVTIAAGDNVTLSRSSNQLTISSTVPVVETWADVAGDVISWGSTGTFNSGKQVGIGTLNAARLLDVNGDAQLRGAIYNSSSSAGSSGQVLTSGGTGAWSWATPADGSATNELQTISTSGAAGNITLSNGGGTLNLNVNDADASTTNELQTLSHSSDATTHTTTLSNSGGSLILAEGSGIRLTTSSNQVTISSSVPSGSAELALTSDLTITGITTTPIKVDFGATDAITNNYGTTNLMITYSGSFDPDATGNLKFAIYKNGSNIGYKSELNVWTQGTHSGMPFSKRFKTSSILNDTFELYIIDTGDVFSQIDLKNVVFLIELIE